MQTRGVELYNRKSAIESFDDIIAIPKTTRDLKAYKRRRERWAQIEREIAENRDVPEPDGVETSEEPAKKTAPIQRRVPNFSTPKWKSYCALEEIERMYTIKITSIEYHYLELLVVRSEVKNGVIEEDGMKYIRINNWYHGFVKPRLTDLVKLRVDELKTRGEPIGARWKQPSAISRFDLSAVRFNDNVSLNEFDLLKSRDKPCEMVAYERFKELLENPNFEVDLDCALKYYDVHIGYMVNAYYTKISGLECAWFVTDEKTCDSCLQLATTLLRIQETEQNIIYEEHKKFFEMPPAFSDGSDIEEEFDRPPASVAKVKPEVKQQPEQRKAKRWPGDVEKASILENHPTVMLSFNLNEKEEEDESIRFSFTMTDLQNHVKSIRRKSARQRKPKLTFDSDNKLKCATQSDFTNGHMYFSEQLDEMLTSTESTLGKIMREHVDFIELERWKYDRLDHVPTDVEALRMKCVMIPKQIQLARKFQNVVRKELQDHFETQKTHLQEHEEFLGYKLMGIKKPAASKPREPQLMVLVKEEDAVGLTIHTS